MEKIRRNPAKLSQLVKEFDLEILYQATSYEEQTLSISDVNRPALQLVGFYDYFQPSRLQILGRAEVMFLKAMAAEPRRHVLDELLRCEIPALIISRNMDVFPELIELAAKYDRTLLRTPSTTVDISSRIIDFLNRKLAPQITRHGVLMNIYGQGVLMMGDSGIGKSETAIELLKRGHRLVADDAVDIRRVSNSLYGDQQRPVPSPHAGHRAPARRGNRYPLEHADGRQLPAGRADSDRVHLRQPQDHRRLCISWNEISNEEGT